MSDAWLVIGALAVATVAIKASGPLAVGGRELPPRVLSVIALLAPALLAALITVETFASEHRALSLDARAVGLAAAGLALLLRGSLLTCVAAAAAAAAGARIIA